MNAADFTMTKKDLEDVCKTTKTAMTDLVKKEEAGNKTKREKIKA